MNYSFLKTTRLFKGISEDEIRSIFRCFDAKIINYKKNELIFHEGETINSFGMVLSGGVNIEHNDYWGNRAIINHICSGLIFGETYAMMSAQPLMVDAVASEDSEIIFFNISGVINPCKSLCEYHSILINNLLAIFASKNLVLSKRMFHTSFKTLRSKLLSYLSDQERSIGSNCFTIPYNRQQLADYLNADRSAMCNEISKMKKDGIIHVSKNTFTLIQNDNF